MGETLFLPQNFAQTAYYKNAMECVQITGNYFGQRTDEGITAQARAFVALYDRIIKNNSLEVKFPFDSMSFAISFSACCSKDMDSKDSSD